MVYKLEQNYTNYSTTCLLRLGYVTKSISHTIISGQKKKKKLSDHSVTKYKKLPCSFCYSSVVSHCVDIPKHL